MTGESRYLREKMEKDNCYSNMQVVFVDVVSYSRRRSHAQIRVIHAFMKAIEDALSSTAREYIDYTQGIDAQLRRDVIVLPTGDGAAVVFPFEGVPEMHLSFAVELFRTIDEINSSTDCRNFREQGWCDCHATYLLRCGIAEGRLILYRDLNGNFNVAGDVVNMAGRVMGLADANQIFLTQDAYRLAADMIPSIGTQFREYRQVEIKHGLRINVYQYINGHDGLDVSPRAGLGLADDETQVDRSITPQPEFNGASRDAHGLMCPDSEVGQPLLGKLHDRMVRVPAGEFLMGSERTDQVEVEISQPLMIDKYLVTQDLYVEVIGRNPSRFTGPLLPVDNASWFDAVTFCNRLSVLTGLDPAYEVLGREAIVDVNKNGYRLPSEAEWEYCCRGDNVEERYGPIDDIAWYNANAGGKTHEVGTKESNTFGVFDMLGNVWEWCNDWYQRRYPKARQTNYPGPADGFERVRRGGSWNDLPDCIRASFRHRETAFAHDSTCGFRIVRPLTEAEKRELQIEGGNNVRFRYPSRRYTQNTAHHDGWYDRWSSRNG